MSSIRSLAKGLAEIFGKGVAAAKDSAGIGKDIAVAAGERPAVEVTPAMKEQAGKTLAAMTEREVASGAPFKEAAPFKEVVELQEALYNHIQDQTRDETRKIGRVLTSIYQDARSQQSKEKLKMLAGEWGVDLTPASGAKTLEGVGDDIDALLATEGLNGMMKRFKGGVEARIEAASINEVRSQVEPFFGSEKIEAILTDTTKSNFEKALDMQKMLVSIQDSVNVELKKNPDSLLNLADKAFRDLPMAMNDLYVTASKNGLAATADATREAIMFQKYGGRATEKVVNLIQSAEDAFATIDKVDPKKADALRKYIEVGADFSGRMKTGAAGRELPVDARAHAFIKSKYGVELSYEDIEFANRVRSVQRFAQRNLFRQETKREYVDDLPFYRLDEIDPADTSFWFEKYGDKDFGHNFWHLVPTEDYLKTALADKPDLRLALESTRDDLIKHSTYFQNQKTRLVKLQDGSEVPMSYVFSDANRLRPQEELSQLSKQYRGYVKGRVGRDRINGILATIALPTGKMTERQPLYKMVDEIRQFHEDTLTTNAPATAGGKMIANVTQGMVSLALFKPAMDLNNALQGVVNGATYHGFTRTMLATAVAGVKMPYYTLRNKGNVRAAWEDMANGFSDPEKRAVVKRIVAESSETRRFLDEDLRGMNGKWNGLLNMLTLPFEMADRVARTATISAAYDQSKIAFDKFIKNVGKMGRDEAAKQLMRDLNLATWQQTAREDLMTLILKKGDMRQARYEYAKYATDMENFVYTKDAAPRIIAWARAQNAVLAQAAIFASYPMHYWNQIVKGALRAAKEGDRRQLAKLAGFSFAWVVAMKYGQSIMDEDDAPLASMFGVHPKQLAAYMVNKGPLVNVTGIPELAYRPIGNLYTGAAALSDGAMLIGYKKLGDMLDSVYRVEGNDSLDWQYLNAVSQIKKSLPYQAGRDIDDAYKILRKFAEEYDE